MQDKKYNSDELLLIRLGDKSKFAVFVKESYIRDKNIQVELVRDYSKVWIRESQII